MAQRAYTITRERIVMVIAVVVVCLVGALLPYFTVTYLNFTSEVVRRRTLCSRPPGCWARWTSAISHQPAGPR